MPDLQQRHTSEWLGFFERQGFPEVAPLATGMEGAVYTLGQGKVAKVWNNARPGALVRLQAFYADVQTAGLPFATPVIEQILEVSSHAVTIEKELNGRPLQEHLSIDSRQVPPETVDTLTRILSALASVPATPAMRAMPVLGEEQPFREEGQPFGQALLALLERGVERFGASWQQEIGDFEELYATLREGLQRLIPWPDVALHGDLYGGNILLDADGALSAVLDFGLFSTAGDPRFDAAVCAAVMNMYGPAAPQLMNALTLQFSAALGSSVQVLRLYQATYALATSHVYAPDGSDGHFRWCTEQWRKPEIRRAITACSAL